MTQLRQQMIRAMDLKNLSDQSQRSYLSAVTRLARHYGQSPETISATMIEDWLLYLKNKKGYAPGSCSIALSGVRFFYTHVLGKQIEVGFSLSKKPRKLPCVLTKQQVGKIIYGPRNLKHRLMLMTTYSAGLRAGEVTRLKIDDIDSKRILMRQVAGIDIRRCPICHKGRMQLYRLIPKGLARPPNPLAFAAGQPC